MRGRCKWYSNRHGYGFVNSTEDQRDYFFHLSKIIGKLPQPGDRLEFNLSKGRKGTEATEVRSIEAGGRGKSRKG